MTRKDKKEKEYREVLYNSLKFFYNEEKSRELTEKLVLKYASISVIANLPRKVLMRDGLSEKVIDFLNFVKVLSESRLKFISSKPFLLDNIETINPQKIFNRLSTYHIRLSGVEKATIYILDDNANVTDRIEYEGDKYTVNISTDEIMKRVKESGMKNIIIAHGHPNSDSSPSSEDIILTKDIVWLMDLFGVKVIDHYIISKDDVYSFRLTRLMGIIEEIVEIDKYKRRDFISYNKDIKTDSTKRNLTEKEILKIRKMKWLCKFKDCDIFGQMNKNRERDIINNFLDTFYEFNRKDNLRLTKE